MDDLINDFIAETRDMLQNLSGAIVAWEAEPHDRARLDEIFRFVHTVKGNCGFFNLPRLQQLSHAAEDALVEVRAERRVADARLVSAVLAVIDRIGELIEAMEAGESVASEDDEQLIAALGAKAEAPAPEVSHLAPDSESRKPVRSIRLSVDLLDRMMSGVSDAVLARNELSRCLRNQERDVAVEAAFERVSGCIAEIREAITRTRMQRIESLFAPLPRIVRDLCGELGKQVRLESDGGDVELDREMIEMIRDPLTHIVRNAIDHGIEAPKTRKAAGKPETGRLRVSARQAGNQILIEVVDDGSGIDGDALVRKAVSAGILSAERADRLSPQQRIDLMFAPGLSTAGEVTAISGRGVGMDVVRANVERIGGVIDVDSRPGDGLRLTIRVPLTLTIIPALTVSAGGQVFAIPRSAIDEILRATAESVRIERVGEARVVSFRDSRVPLVALADLLDVAGDGDEVAGNAGASIALSGGKRSSNIILLKPAGGDVFALAVDAVHDHEELVVKPASPLVMAAGLYAGTTLADDGKPILLLDPAGVAKVAGIRFDQEGAEGGEESASGESPVAHETSLLLFKGFDGGLRAVPVPLVERIEDVPADAIRFSAGRLRLSVGARILPLGGIDVAPSEGKIRILRLSDGASEVAYAFAEVVDIRSVVIDLRKAPLPGEIAGVALIEGAQVELIDSHWLFSALLDDVSAGTDRPVCALPQGDPWMENMLRPMIEGLGYRIVAAGKNVVADIVIASADDATEPLGSADTIVRIRARPEVSGERDESIYRYDRDGLLNALSSGARKGGRNG